jgi:hypothetical protein
MGCGHCERCNSKQFVNLACRHVSVAAESNAPWFDAVHFLYGDQDDPDLGMIYSGTFCLSCINELALPPSGSLLPEATSVAALEASTGVCDGCLRRWWQRDGGSGQ